MKKLFIFCAVAAFALSISQQVFAENDRAKANEGKAKAERTELAPVGSILFGNETLGGAQTVDMVRVKCKGGLSTISADVLDVGPNLDVTYHVTVTCDKPKPFAFAATSATDGGLATPATVFFCKQALITFTCDVNDFCDDSYNSLISCGANEVKRLDFLTDQD